MTRFTRFCPGYECVALDEFAPSLLMKYMTSFTAQPLLQHDIWHGMIDAFPSLSYVQSLLGAVEVCVTCLAIGDGLDILDDLVLDFHMALVAFDFIFGNMFGVHQICVFEFL